MWDHPGKTFTLIGESREDLEEVVEFGLRTSRITSTFNLMDSMMVTEGWMKLRFKGKKKCRPISDCPVYIDFNVNSFPRTFSPWLCMASRPCGFDRKYAVHVPFLKDNPKLDSVAFYIVGLGSPFQKSLFG